MNGFLDRKLLFVTGKGGVGKTTVTAALGVAAARRHKRVLVCEIDTDPAMRRLFATGELGLEPKPVAPGLWACNLSGPDCMHAFIRRTVPSERVTNLLLANKAVSVFFDSAPSVLEAVILDQIAIRVNQDFDLVIVDLPASGHAVTFLRVARSMAEMVSVGELAQHLRTVDALLSHPDQSGLVLVTLPEEMPTNETIELSRNIEGRVTTPICAVVVNGIKASGLHDDDEAWVRGLLQTAPPAQREDLHSIAAGTSLGRYWHEQEAEQVDRLKAAIHVPLLDAPYVFDKAREADLVQRVATRLGEQL